MKDCVEAHPEYYGAMANVDDDDDDAMEGEIVNEGEYGERLEHQTTVESKIVGSSSLKNLVYIMELFRVLKSGETEVVLVLGYKQ